MKQLDPLGSLRRTHYCGTLRPEHVGQEATLCGWVHRRRDHGGRVCGLCVTARAWGRWSSSQIRRQKRMRRPDELRSEYVIAVRGKVEPRGEEAINPKLPTGEVELVATELRILNTATTPPFVLEDDAQVDEALRLRYRIHDLRRPLMQQRLSHAAPTLAVGAGDVY